MTHCLVHILIASQHVTCSGFMKPLIWFLVDTFKSSVSQLHVRDLVDIFAYKYIMQHRPILEFRLYPLSKKYINGWFHPFMGINPNPSQIQPYSIREGCVS